MAKFYRSALFKELQAQWRDRLAKDGFIDHENEKEVLKQYNRRNQAWEDREIIKDQILRMECKLAAYGNTLNPKHRQVLALYISGARIKEICKQTGFCRYWIRQIIRKHR